MRIAVISPFLDRQHGTERCIIEQLERLVTYPDREIHVYAQYVKDLKFTKYPDVSRGQVVWHRVSRLPAPHLFAYIWWFVANRLQRWWDARTKGLRFDVLYSPGINAFDADAIAVHVVFHELYSQMQSQDRFRAVSVRHWPIAAHRILYYRLICALENHIYRNRNIRLSAISQHTATSMNNFFQREDVSVARHGVDTLTFDPQTRAVRRGGARASLNVRSEEFCLLLIGNDWRNKGLPCLMEAVSRLRDLPLKLLVVGTDNKELFERSAQTAGLGDLISFHAPSPDVMRFYSAADLYVAPSMEDAYGLPVVEAMACGLPVICSSRAGASEIIVDGENGKLLQNPHDSSELAELIRKLCTNRELCNQLGINARVTAEQNTWDANARSMWDFLLQSKRL